MDTRTFNQFRDLIYAKSGITLREGKEALVEGRVNKRVRSLGLSSLRDYLRYLECDDSGEEMVRFLDVISTNVTHFFREAEHFNILERLLKKWAEEGQTKFRIWCAASSTGEEPYSIAMTSDAAISMAGMDFRILATDISTRVLQIAKEGKYSKESKKDLPLKFQTAAYLSSSGAAGIQMSERLQRMLTFARLNLSIPPFPMKGPFDVIFCRNVMIYFDDVVRRRLVTEMVRLLKPGGYLFVGHSESLSGLNIDIRAVGPSVYMKDGE